MKQDRPSLQHPNRLHQKDIEERMKVNIHERPQRLPLEAFEQKNWVPQVTLLEKCDTFEIEALIPGLSPEQVEVRIFNNYLVLSGEKPVRENERQKKSRFLRKILLPCLVDASRINVHFGYNILRITTPKKGKSAA